MLIDTHTHLYLEQFDEDRVAVVDRAVFATPQPIEQMCLPNIDSTSVEAMLKMVDQWPAHCFPMMGLHPSSVKANYRDELAKVEAWLDRRSFVAIGEIGIDLYWDKTYKEEQVAALEHQLLLAQRYDLPVVLHVREAFDEVFAVLEQFSEANLRGVFHCFSGDLDQARQAIDMGFKLGVGGVVTYKKSDLPKIVQAVDLKDIVLETDSPYLAPVPRRGKRNESSYLLHVAQRVADLRGILLEDVATSTTQTAQKLFNLPYDGSIYS